jgi:peptidoglycan hydrolase CwlO-like protein
VEKPGKAIDIGALKDVSVLLLSEFHLSFVQAEEKFRKANRDLKAAKEAKKNMEAELNQRQAKIDELQQSLDSTFARANAIQQTTEKERVSFQSLCTDEGLTNF